MNARTPPDLTLESNQTPQNAILDPALINKVGDIGLINSEKYLRRNKRALCFFLSTFFVLVLLCTSLCFVVIIYSTAESIITALVTFGINILVDALIVRPVLIFYFILLTHVLSCCQSDSELEEVNIS
jgi:hypothetical protein